MITDSLAFWLQANVIMQMCGSDGRPRVDIRQQPFAAPEKLREVVTVTYKNLKQRKTTVQRSMSLYLANRDTEYILFKPLKVIRKLNSLSGCINLRSLYFCRIFLFCSLDGCALFFYCLSHGVLLSPVALKISVVLVAINSVRCRSFSTVCHLVVQRFLNFHLF